MWTMLLVACGSFAVIPYDPSWSVAVAGPTDACGWRADDYLACADPWTSAEGDVNDGITDGTAGAYGDQGFQGVAVAMDAACTLDGETGAPRCWGEPDSPLVADNPVGAITAALLPETLVAGDGHACGLDAFGAPWCWGDDEAGQASPPEGSRFDALAAGADHTCGIDDGALRCWGGGLDDPPTYVVQSATGVEEVAAGDGLTCALTSTGAVWCSRSPLDEGSAAEYVWAPQGVGALHDLAVGELGVCALSRDDELVCALAYEDATLPTAPLAHLTLSSARAFGCGVTTRGELDCFGGEDVPDLEAWTD